MYLKGTWWSKVSKGYLVVQSIQRLPCGPRYTKVKYIKRVPSGPMLARTNSEDTQCKCWPLSSPRNKELGTNWLWWVKRLSAPSYVLAGLSEWDEGFNWVGQMTHPTLAARVFLLTVFMVCWLDHSALFWPLAAEGNLPGSLKCLRKQWSFAEAALQHNTLHWTLQQTLKYSDSE